MVLNEGRIFQIKTTYENSEKKWNSLIDIRNKNIEKIY
jgi:hypothetical protein